jgi:hypothetical protein
MKTIVSGNMPASVSLWQIALARLEGALPFISTDLAPILAQHSLCTMWAIHIRDFPFDDKGIDHDPGPDARQLMRSWYDIERRDFLSWIVRRGHPPLAQAASLALAAKGQTESFSRRFGDADRAIARIDALLPAEHGFEALTELVLALRREEIAFLEGGTEEALIEGHVFHRPAPRGSAWAASLALAVRPHIFGLGAAPFALAGLAPRALLRAEPEEPIRTIAASAITHAAQGVTSALLDIRARLDEAASRLSGRYASSRASDAFALLLGLGPLTRAEIARALDVTPRTGSHCAEALAEAGLAMFRQHDRALALRSLAPASEGMRPMSVLNRQTDCR